MSMTDNIHQLKIAIYLDPTIKYWIEFNLALIRRTFRLTVHCPVIYPWSSDDSVLSQLFETDDWKNLPEVSDIWKNVFYWSNS